MPKKFVKPCPKCGSTKLQNYTTDAGNNRTECQKCGHKFKRRADDGTFQSSYKRDVTLETFEKELKGIMLRGAMAALMKEKGTVARINRQGEIVITKVHKPLEKWEHHFSIETWASHI